jgi:hypothetical protein
MKKLLACLLVASACGGDDGGREPLFQPKPECMGDAVTPLAGTFPQIINTLAIGAPGDGFDLDGDGKPDNKLSAAGTLAGDAVANSIKNYEIIIPLEFFDFPAVAADQCVKFAIYYGTFDKDSDGDGKRPGIAKGDCNDTQMAIAPGAPEIADNRIDDDCNGLADDMGSDMPSTDTGDMDGDGQSIAAGDCDDTNNKIKKGAPEICGDGLDNDCDGVADRSVDGSGNVTACSPYDAAQDITLDPLSLESGAPVIAFKDGTVSDSNVITAGPSIFSVNIPIMAGVTLDLRITGATIQATLGADGTTMNGKLGGVIDAQSADNIRGLDVSAIMLKPDQSLLDATFANVLGTLLALPKAKESIQKKYPGCRTPDIDVDGDGLEAFCNSKDADQTAPKIVDVCIDGDGTEVRDENGVDCTKALDKNGKPRFVDGISVELNFQTTRIHAIKPAP